MGRNGKCPSASRSPPRRARGHGCERGQVVAVAAGLDGSPTLVPVGTVVGVVEAPGSVHTRFSLESSTEAARHMTAQVST
jgi:hypothetical protein